MRSQALTQSSGFVECEIGTKLAYPSFSPAGSFQGESIPIQVVCSNAQCRKPLKVRDELADKKVKCPKCETVTQVTEDRVLPFLQLGSYSLVRKIGEGEPAAGLKPRKT